METIILSYNINWLSLIRKLKETLSLTIYLKIPLNNLLWWMPIDKWRKNNMFILNLWLILINLNSSNKILKLFKNLNLYKSLALKKLIFPYHLKKSVLIYKCKNGYLKTKGYFLNQVIKLSINKIFLEFLYTVNKKVIISQREKLWIC